MKTRIALLSILIFSVCLQSQGQSKKRTVKNKQTVEKTEEQLRVEELYANMLMSTAQVMFIDSVVVDSAEFITKIPLGRESGRVCPLSELTNADGQHSAYAYINEWGNRLFYSSAGQDGKLSLYSADKIGGEWTEERLIDEFGDDFEDINCPYMMADGTTLYFSAKGREGLGGYDIYVTRYDTESARFYRPENIGLPYNSTGNDYYCIIDEFNNIGWLVTDRRQPSGKVCVYTFVPQQSRAVYDSDAISEDKLNNLAELRSISATWTSKAELAKARERAASLMADNDGITANAIEFIINDRTVYTRLSDFRIAANKSRYAKLLKMKKSITELEKKIDNMRREYAQSQPQRRRRLAAELKGMEQTFESLEIQAVALEKEIRNTENMSMRRNGN